MQFADLRLAEPILRALVSEGYSTATPIQAKAIPHVLAGLDVLGCAQTGTGKTAAFALPILQRLAESRHGGDAMRTPRALILCPTRELATQIADSFRAYGQNLRFRQFVLFGGVNQNPQVQALRRGVDILIATPGRLLDLMNQGHVDLRRIEVLVLDEADRMLDMGFIHDIRKVVAAVPKERQTLLFSATMPPEIRRLADDLLDDPVDVKVAPVSSTVDTIEQSVYFVEKRHKTYLLAHLVNHLPMTRAIVFTRTKHGADKVVRQLHTRGIRAEAIHGNKSQNARERALNNFRASKTPVLVATDIASRGIDIDDVTHVVNYDVTHEPETYVHRIGRTGRAGASGMAISLCGPEEVSNLKAIEKLIRRAITVRTDHPAYPASDPAARTAVPAALEHRRPIHATQPAHTRRPKHGAKPMSAPQPRQSSGHDRAAAPAHRSSPGGRPKQRGGRKPVRAGTRRRGW